MKKSIFLLVLISIFSSTALFSQNNLCDQANPFCSNQGAINFPAGVNAGTAEVGADYGCLGSEPNPAWY